MTDTNTALPVSEPTTDPHDIMLCVYHADCLDGFTAAWVVRKMAMQYSIPVAFQAAHYGTTLPEEDFEGRHVLIVDFSYPRAELERMAAKAKSVMIIDHHKSAQEALADLPALFPFRQWTRSKTSYGVIKSGAGENKLVANFDMARSGCGLVWNYFYPIKDVPRLVAHVQDRDLWRFNIRDTREINALLASYPYEFDVWDKLAEALEDNQQRRLIVQCGLSIQRKMFKDIEAIVLAGTRRTKIAGYDVPVLNAPPMWASEAGNILAQGEPFAATYFVNKDGEHLYSLRSTKDGLDVSEIAKKFGGGGHRNAAGFKAGPGAILEDA